MPFQWNTEKKRRKKNNYMDLAREPRMTMIPTVIVTLRTVHKGFEIGLKESRLSRRKYFYDWLKYPEESCRPKGTCCHTDSSERRTYVGVKKLPGVK